MRPKEVTFRVLKVTLDVAVDKMRKGIWSEINVKTYRTANGINKLGTHKLIDSVNNVLALEYYRYDNHQQTDQSNTKRVLNNFKRYLDAYKL